MTKQESNVRTGTQRSALRGTLALIFGVGLVLAAKTMSAGDARPGFIVAPFTTQLSAQQSEQAAALLSAMRGVNPVACRLASRSLGNNWGNGGMLASADELSAADQAVYEWATSSALEPSAIPTVRRSLVDTDACVRRTAAMLLGRARVKALAPELRDELGSADATTREAALYAIGQAGHKADVTAAQRALEDTNARVRLTAVWALGMIGDASAVPALIPMLRDRDVAMRINAAYALGSIESADAIPALADLLGSDADARVRRAAAAALGQIDG